MRAGKTLTAMEEIKKDKLGGYLPCLPLEQLEGWFNYANIGMAFSYDGIMVSDSYSIAITANTLKLQKKKGERDTSKQMKRGRGERGKEGERKGLTSSISFTMEERASRKEGR